MSQYPAFRVLAVGDGFLYRLPIRHAAGQIGKLDQPAAAFILGQRPHRKAILGVTHWSLAPPR